MFRHLVAIIVSTILVLIGYNSNFHSDASVVVESKPARKLEPITIDLERIAESIEPPDPYAGLDIDQVHCLAKNIYFEARGESTNGKIAVANVTMNRVFNSKYPNTICGVVEQAVYSSWWKEHHNRLVPVRWKCQFTWYCDGKSDNIKLTTADGTVIRPNMLAWEKSLEIAIGVVRGHHEDITNGATHYYNPSLANPKWAAAYQHVAMIDNHSFHRR